MTRRRLDDPSSLAPVVHRAQSRPGQRPPGAQDRQGGETLAFLFPHDKVGCLATLDRVISGNCLLVSVINGYK